MTTKTFGFGVSFGRNCQPQFRHSFGFGRNYSVTFGASFGFGETEKKQIRSNSDFNQTNGTHEQYMTKLYLLWLAMWSASLVF